MSRVPETLRNAEIDYLPTDNVASFIAKVDRGSVMDLVWLERHGVRSRLLRDIAKEMGISTVRVYDILGVTNATVTRKALGGAWVTGMAAQAALNMARLLGLAADIAAASTASANFDSAKWLGRWIELPQPALGGRHPADLMDTLTGAAAVAKVLGAIESGAYQ